MIKCVYVEIMGNKTAERFVLADVLKLCSANWQIDHKAEKLEAELLQGGKQPRGGLAVTHY